MKRVLWNDWILPLKICQTIVWSHHSNLHGFILNWLNFTHGNSPFTIVWQIFASKIHIYYFFTEFSKAKFTFTFFSLNFRRQISHLPFFFVEFSQAKFTFFFSLNFRRRIYHCSLNFHTWYSVNSKEIRKRDFPKQILHIDFVTPSKLFCNSAIKVTCSFCINL